MKWLIASDLHGSVDCCKRLMEAYEREGAQRLLLLGDLLSGGVLGTGKKKVADMLNEKKAVITCVRGNCDSESDMAMLEFPMREVDVVPIPEIKGRMVFATHGHRYNGGHLPPNMRRGDILLHGHTHTPMTERRTDFLCFNPGSVAQPRGGSERGYMTLDNGVFRWVTLDGEEYRAYELEQL